MKNHRENIIRNFFTPHEMQEVTSFFDLFSPDVVISVPRHLPWGGSYYGLRGIGDLLSNVSRFILAEIVVEETFTCGEQVVAIGRLQGKSVETGERLDARVVHVFTFQGEKIGRVEFLGEIGINTVSPQTNGYVCAGTKSSNSGCYKPETGMIA